MAADRFLQAIDKIYAAAVAPETWPVALEAVARLLQADRLCLTTHGRDETRVWKNTKSRPIGGPIAGKRQCEPSPRPAAHAAGAPVLARRFADSKAAVSATRRRRVFNATDVALFEKFVRHLEIAVRIADRLSEASAQMVEGSCILHRLNAQTSQAAGQMSGFAFTVPGRASLGKRALDVPIPPNMLRDLYGLTAAEANLCNALLRESGLRAAAARLGISINTAKTELQCIFQKTAVTRQADLMRLLANGPWLLLRLEKDNALGAGNRQRAAFLGAAQQRV